MNPGYDLESLEAKEGLRYFFKSTGDKEIIKYLEYSIVETKHNVIKTEKIFNLGFADFNPKTQEFTDNINSNNGDAYKVFYTILNSIPLFFEKYPNEAITVTGSDSRDNFAERCFDDCKKKCIKSEQCKNKDRRINIYINYIDKNFDELKKEYSFFGGIDETIEPFQRNKKYRSIFVVRNKIDTEKDAQTNLQNNL